MAEFTVNALRFDPYKNFKFRVRWDGRSAAGGRSLRQRINTAWISFLTRERQRASCAARQAPPRPRMRSSAVHTRRARRPKAAGQCGDGNPTQADLV
jgi:hypothetical protein